MAKKTVLNATTSINYWFETVIKPAVHADVSRDVCFYYEENQKLTYPAVYIDHYTIGAPYNLQKMNQISMNVFVNKSMDIMAWGLQDCFFNTSGLTTENASGIKMIPLYDWADKLNPVQYGCVRILLEDGNGFTQQGDDDREVRHYRLDLDAYYY